MLKKIAGVAVVCAVGYGLYQAVKHINGCLVVGRFDPSSFDFPDEETGDPVFFGDASEDASFSSPEAAEEAQQAEFAEGCQTAECAETAQDEASLCMEKGRVF